MPKSLLDPQKGSSYQVDETAFQDALNTTKSRWDWLEEKITPEEIVSHEVAVGSPAGYPGVPEPRKYINGSMKDGSFPRPEHEIFTLSMQGGGKVHGAAHPYGQSFSSFSTAL